MATSRGDIQDPTGQHANLPGYGFTMGFGIGTQYTATNGVNGVAGNPINGETGWCKGALFMNPKATATGQYLWVNIGTSTSAIWQNIA